MDSKKLILLLSFSFSSGLAFSGETEMIWSEQQVPAWIYSKNTQGFLFHRSEQDAGKQALLAINTYAKAFRVRGDDRFEVRNIVEDNGPGDLKYPPFDVADSTQLTMGDTGGKKGIDESKESLTNVQLQQIHQGLVVSGGEMIVSMTAENVVSIQGRFYPDIALEKKDGLTQNVLTQIVEKKLEQENRVKVNLVWLNAEPQIRIDANNVAHHVRIANISYQVQDNYFNDKLLVDTNDGSIVARISNIHRAEKIINDWHSVTSPERARCVTLGSILPPEIMMFAPRDNIFSGPTASYSSSSIDFYNNPGAVADPGRLVHAVWWGSELTDNFYRSLFKWRSFDGLDSPLISNLRISIFGAAGCTTNNAYWMIGSLATGAPEPYERQVYFSPSSTVTGVVPFGETASDANAVTHELTHGYTEMSSNLEYEGESGAINEASSDIMAESIEWWTSREYYFKKIPLLDWQTATTIFSPGYNSNFPLFNAGKNDALRYYFNPGLDRYNGSRGPDGVMYPARIAPDYSATLYRSRNGGPHCRADDVNDFCHVHTNSGILNHFFFLLARGGQNPRDEQDTRVGVSPYTHGIGIAKAMGIWYGATLGGGAYRITSRSTFRDLRNATIRVAQQRFPEIDDVCSTQVLAVLDAWDKTGWTDSPNPALDMTACSGQTNLVRNGTLENGASRTSTGYLVSDWLLEPASYGFPPPRELGASFQVNSRSTDEMLSAFLGGTGVESRNRVSTTISFPRSETTAAHLRFVTDRVINAVDLSEAGDARDTLTVEIVTAGRTVFESEQTIFERTIPSTELRSWAGKPVHWNLALNAEQRAALNGQNARIRFTYNENNGAATKAVIDAVSLIVVE